MSIVGFIFYLLRPYTVSMPVLLYSFICQISAFFKFLASDVCVFLYIYICVYVYLVAQTYFLFKATIARQDYVAPKKMVTLQAE